MAKVKAGIKRRAETTNDRSSQMILVTKLVGIIGNATVNLPSVEMMRRKVLPMLSQAYQETGRFVLCGSVVANPKTVMIFSSQKGIEFLLNISLAMIHSLCAPVPKCDFNKAALQLS